MKWKKNDLSIRYGVQQSSGGREILQVYGKKNVCQEKAKCGLDTCRNFVTAAVLAQQRRSKILLKGTVCYMSECFHLDHMCLSRKMIPLDKSAFRQP